ncbi:MAG: 2-amino-4-hydroxy-6-hydroxymethyldihydropteridine diphosphokinase [Acidobacteria bacterium]|nr:MAG: 2-amino-4-hydroxy-6-hydroxymethyldihydropteridine diphosphokinase [Acidobacteriota bacterium]REK03147.1 MAG: 2-amino-4-hydroxy-6-hydroxymethyldihydropteridine diphosphokinase [Acidobacteriota bacterium]REK15398.1 MAG: 2-amino-4-hydroxy-6-hydroxymethyldihydropteridine diphosphokinase [Acidobacteriota bacterium]REK42117.1 MAG: 2-amino-4-hydroxy-6-hydroxymethyldihydropteridine diphosphokinase [Acidobacteriota bacterium]
MAYIGLGSNLGDRAGNLLLGVRGLMESGLVVTRLSAIYETEPVGVTEHGHYLNMVAEVRTGNITPSQMMARMIRVEYLLGRRHKFLQAPRTADLDLLFYGDVIIDNDFLKVPHKSVHRRKFVLVPMAELSPHLIHPVENKSIETILSEVDDLSSVSRWNPNDEIRQHEAIHSTDDRAISRSTSSSKS